MRIRSIIDRKFIELTGCIHNHSIYSFDGEIPVGKILQAAKQNDLDYVTINDHMSLEASFDPDVKNEQELLVIVGAEINDKDQNNHYLAFNIDKIIESDDAKEYVGKYHKMGAIGFAAHPIERRKDERFRKYNWTDPRVDEFDGLEIWNFLSEWVSRLKPSYNGIWMVLFPWLFVPKPYRMNIQWWDKLNLEGKRKSAIGSVDCHEESHPLFGITFRFLKHKNIFKTIRTNVLLPEGSEINEINVLQAMKKGNSYIVNYRIGNPYNFYYTISGKNGSAIAGEEIKFQENLKMYYQIPRMASVHIFHDGHRIKKIFSDKGEIKINEKGNYRIEVFSLGRGWIYTNNIYVI